jgi:hypothetical protein
MCAPGTTRMASDTPSNTREAPTGTGVSVGSTAERFRPMALLMLLALLLVTTSLGKRLVSDEPYHLAYGYRFLIEGPEVRMRERLPVVALSALPCLLSGCERSTLDTSEVRRLLVRGPTMLFALALGLVLYLWVREALGSAAAHLTLALYVTNPTVLAHGKQVTNDIATAFFTAVSLYAAWRFSRQAGARPWLLCVLATAGAALSKYTALYLLVLAPALALSCGLCRTSWRRFGRGLALSVAFVAAVLLLVNAAYRFSGTLAPISTVALESRTLTRLATLDLPLPVPAPYAKGFDFALAIDERIAGDNLEKVNIGLNYVLGRRNSGGVWYAFPLMVLLKTPLAFFLLAGYALVRTVRPTTPPLWRFWLVPGILHLAYFSLGVRVQIGIRYLLPALVLFIPVAGAAAYSARRMRPLALGVLTLWHALSTLSYLPHPMSYFNELIGRRVHAYRFLADSNLDWEDRRRDVALYLARNPGLEIAVEPEEPCVGHVLVGTNRLLGILGDDSYRALRRLEPIDHVGYSFLLFRVQPEDLLSREHGPRPRSPYSKYR